MLDGRSASFDICMQRYALPAEMRILTDPAAGASYHGPAKDTTAIRATAEVRSGGTIILALPPQIGDAAADEESAPMLLVIVTPRMFEGD